MNMILGKCKFPNSFIPYFQKHVLKVHIGIASMRQFQHVPTTYVHSINECFLTIKQVFHKFLNFIVMSM